MTKIAFFDVDGTMINVPHQLLKPTDKTIHALKEFQKQGNYIVVASARGVKPECLDEIPLMALLDVMEAILNFIKKFY